MSLNNPGTSLVCDATPFKVEEDTRDPTKKETWHFGIAIFRNDVKHVRAYSQNPKRASGWDVSSWLANIVKDSDADLLLLCALRLIRVQNMWQTQIVISVVWSCKKKNLL